MHLAIHACDKKYSYPLDHLSCIDATKNSVVCKEVPCGKWKGLAANFGAKSRLGEVTHQVCPALLLEKNCLLKVILDFLERVSSSEAKVFWLLKVLCSEK
jgi:hypothetical protein